MKTVIPKHLLAVYLAAACAAAQAADPFLPPGAKATLSVDYLYESAGKKSAPNSGYDPYEWRVKRSASLTAELAAHPATAMPTVQAIDAAQMTHLTGKVDKAQGVATKMAPMLADVQRIIAKCGDNEACMTREAEKMGAALQGTPQMATAMSAKKDIQELSKQDGLRYQAWRATAQKGSYLIDEKVHISVVDPICTGKPGNRCTRDEVRKGGGEIPVLADKNAKRNKDAAAGFSAVEVDAGKNTLTVTLPVPLLPLPYTETIVTDEPAGTHDTPTPKGPQAKQLAYRVSAAGSGIMDKPFTVPLKGGFRTQSGEQVVKLKGNFGNEGTLTVRWRFAVQ